MEILTKTVAKVLFGLPFLIFGIMHFLGADDMKGMVPFPPQLLWVYLTGIALIAASIAIMTGKLGKLAGLLLALMLVIFALTIHLPSAMDGDQAGMSNMLKDLALAGGALTWAGIYEDEEDTAGSGSDA